jgi:predicted DNA-binding transcriptional regulator AlpA
METASFELITRQMAAEILKVSLGTLDRHIREGDIPPPKPIGHGRQLYWLPEEFYGSVRRALSTEAQCSPLPDQTEAAPRPSAPKRSSPLSGTKECATARAARRNRALVKKLNE